MYMNLKQSEQVVDKKLKQTIKLRKANCSSAKITKNVL